MNTLFTSRSQTIRCAPTFCALRATRTLSLSSIASTYPVTVVDASIRGRRGVLVNVTRASALRRAVTNQHPQIEHMVSDRIHGKNRMTWKMNADIIKTLLPHQTIPEMNNTHYPLKVLKYLEKNPNQTVPREVGIKERHSTTDTVITRSSLCKGLVHGVRPEVLFKIET